MKLNRTKLIWLSAAILILALSFLVYARIAEPEERLTGSDDHNASEYESYVAYRQGLPSLSEEVSLLAVGDIMLSRVVADKIATKGEDYPFKKVADWLADVDIAFGNLETPLTPGRRILTGEMVFRADSTLAATLARYNFSVLSLANNHTMNFGSAGMLDTVAALEQVGISPVGGGRDTEAASAPAFVERKGLRFAFLAYNDDDVVPDNYAAQAGKPGTNFMSVEKVRDAVREAKEEADFVIVSMHSGTEYEADHGQRQEEFARAAIDAGAEIVLGHHPHVVQDVEIYKGKYIFYSFGNFIFDQMWSQETRQGLGAKIYFSRSGVSRIALYPLRIDDYAQPNLVSNEEGRKILERLQQNLSGAPLLGKDGERGKQYYLGTVAGDGNLIREEAVDVDEDGQVEIYKLSVGKLVVTEGGSEAWSSPPEWWVDDFHLADTTGSGRKYLHLSVWKAGSFGKSKPFWVKENDDRVRNHLFVLSWADKKIAPVWQSSELDAPNCQIAFIDSDGDGKEELYAIEGSNSDWPDCRGQAVSVWEWNGWGYSNDWRKGGGFTYLDTVDVAGGVSAIAY
mgnify:CR=1 FL=1